MDSQTQKKIDDFLAGERFAVVGASTNREKYGNKVLRTYKQHGRTVFPINPRAEEIEGLRCYPDIASLPEPVHGISVITPPKITESVVEEASKQGIRHVWMQPGAESDEAVRKAEELGLSVIAGGPCVLVVLGFEDR